MGFTKEDMYKLVLIDLSDATQVNSGGGVDTKQLQPPKGFIYEINAIQYVASPPAGDTAGTHRLSIIPNGFTAGGYSMQGEAAHSTTVRINYLTVVSTAVKPPTASSHPQIIGNGNLVASNGIPLDFTYVNDTDAHQTGTRILEILVKKYREAP